MDFMAKQILKDVALEEIPPRAAPDSPGNPMDHWSLPILLERGAYLKKLAKYGDGSASETLREYSQHTAMLSFRGRDSEAEVHQNHANLFCVLAGSATLVTGGIVMRARAVAPGETCGDSIEGGMRQELKAGDIAHVPAAVPHQMLVAGEETVTCFVMKIKEAE